MAGTLKLSNPSKLKYLELSDCLANEIVLQELLGSCYSLQKLSLKGMNHEKGKINSMVMELICKQNGQTLQVLDLSDFNFRLNDTNLLKLSFKHIINYCAILEELNLHSTYPSESDLDFLAKNLTPTISKLDLSGNFLVCKTYVITNLLQRYAYLIKSLVYINLVFHLSWQT